MPGGKRPRRGRGGHGPGPQDAYRNLSIHDHKRQLLTGIEAFDAAFTLADEARSTAHGSTVWSKDSRLRSRPITFVSAGCVDPLRQLEDELHRKALEALDNVLLSPHDGTAIGKVDNPATVVQLGDAMPPRVMQFNHAPLVENTGSTVKDQEYIMHSPEDFAELSPHSLGRTKLSLCAEGTAAHALPKPQSFPTVGSTRVSNNAGPRKPQSPLLFFFDTTRDATRDRSLDDEAQEMGQRSSTGDIPLVADIPEPSRVSDLATSEEDVILFKGRRKHRHKAHLSTPAPGMFNLSGLQAEIRILDGDTESLTRGLLDHALPMSARTQRKREKNEAKRNKTKRKSRSAKGKSAAPIYVASEEDEDDDQIADYIANMRQHVITENTSSEEDRLGDVEAPSMALDTLNTVLGDSRASGYTSSLTPPAGYTDDLSTSSASVALAGADGTAASHLSSSSAANENALQYRGAIDQPIRRSKAQLPPLLHLSDSDLESQLIVSFESSRLKKAEKRKERERLREQGLLGSKAQADDMRTKYKTGMKLEQIADELRAFLNDNQASLTLPPMDNQARKVIHELANKFNIKSKSTGSGEQRRPTLYRTLRTFKYSEEAFDAVISRVGRKYFPRRDRPSLKGLRPSNGNGGNKDISYRDGEVVGWSAPELGESNKGRWMLEKMGWSSGTALGTSSNKGILQPVEQKVKRGKAGLG